MKNLEAVVLACETSTGESTLYISEVEITTEEKEKGLLIDLAIENAKRKGYGEPFLVFDKSEYTNIVSVVSQLNFPIPFTLMDKFNEDKPIQKGHIQFEENNISIQLNGYNDVFCEGDSGIVSIMTYDEDEVTFKVYSDINEDDPTNSISLNRARNEARTIQI